MRRARQKAFDLGLQDFIIVSARSGHGMEELFERTITLVRIYLHVYVYSHDYIGLYVNGVSISSAVIYVYKSN